MADITKVKLPNGSEYNLKDSAVPAWAKATNPPTYYWANLTATSAATYNKAPEMATLKLNGNTSATAASTSNVSLVYNSTTQALDFVFT